MAELLPLLLLLLRGVLEASFGVAASLLHQSARGSGTLARRSVVSLRLPDNKLGSRRQLDATSHLKLTELCLIM